MGALYMECSSKEMTGVHEIFETAINTVVAEQEGLLQPVESNTKTKVFGSAKREGVTSSGSSVGASGAQQQKYQQQSQQMLAPSKKKKRSGCKIL